MIGGSVVVPLDGSDPAEHALLFAGQFAGRLDVPLHLLFVLPTDATEAH